MWKKITYAGLLLILVYFIYAVFYKKIGSPVEQLQKEMKMKKVVYKLRDEVIVYADEQVGGTDKDKIVKFKNVVIDMLKKNMIVKSKEGELNTETLDVTLKGKVFGTSKDNKWNLYTEQVDYKKQGDLIISNTRTKVLNNVDKTQLEANKIETTTKFETIVGSGNVIYQDHKQKKDMRADKAIYNSTNKVLDAEGHVVYKELDPQKSKEVKADKMRYDEVHKILDAEGHVFYKEISNQREFQSDRMHHDDINKITDAQGHAIYRDLKANKTLSADSMRYDDINKIGNAVGNVKYKDPENTITADTANYFMKEERIDAAGHVIYMGKESHIVADRGSYFLKKKQVDALGNVQYTGREMRVTGQHVFYDENKKIVTGDGNGTFEHFAQKTTGTYQSAVYDMGNQVLTTNQDYTMNYQDYHMKGTGLVYLFKTGDATFNNKFSVTKQNFTVSGDNGRMNTIVKDIFANKMVLTSVQGDRVTSDIGQGSFEKKEFKFDGHVKGKIRGNTKNFMTDPTPLVEAEAVNFTGETAKLYFISQNSKNMSITRGEIKNNVHMTYKDVIMDSQYNEIDIAKNTILARDKVMIDLKNHTKLTANFVWFDMNKGEGHAEKSVKIISTLPQFKNINTSADSAIIYLKTKKIGLNGHVKTYQGKTQISSDRAIYDMDRRILENSGNIKMQYEVNNGTVEQSKSDPKNKEAVQNVIGKLTIENANEKGKIVLPRTETADNGVPVNVKWKSSNSTILSPSGKVNKQFYGGKDKDVKMTATARAGTDSSDKSFDVKVPTESTREMLARAASNIYYPENGGKLPSSVRINVHKKAIDIPISWSAGSESGKGGTATLRYNGVEYSKRF